MRNQIKKLLKPSIVAGVELVQREQSMHYNLVVLQQVKEEVKILEKHLRLNSIEALKEKIDASIPIFLAINIRGIIHKKLEENTEDDQRILQAVFPNSSVNSFYLQKELLPNGMIASVVRKETIDEMVLDFESKNLWLLAIRLGSFDVKYLAPYLATHDQLQTETQLLFFSPTAQLLDFSKTPSTENSTITIGDESIDHKLLTAFALAFKALVNPQNNGLITPTIDSNNKEFFHKNLFQKEGWALLGGALVLLLLNLFLYYNYKEKNEQLSTQMIYTNAQLKELDVLKNSVEKQKKFLQQTQLNQNSRSSFVADRIAASLLKGLQLSALDIFPMLGKKEDYKENDLVRYSKEEVLIKGFCENSLIYNDWIKKLQSEDWVKEIQHLDYKDLNNKLGAFELKIITAF